MATHSCVLAWRILWTEEPGGLLSMGSHRVGYDWSDLACMRALEKEMATHSSVPAWSIPETEEPGGLPSMGSHRVGHDWSDLAAAAAVSRGQGSLVCCRLRGGKKSDTVLTNNFSIKIILTNGRSNIIKERCLLFLRNHFPYVRGSTAGLLRSLLNSPQEQ